MRNAKGDLPEMRTCQGLRTPREFKRSARPQQKVRMRNVKSELESRILLEQMRTDKRRTVQNPTRNPDHPGELGSEQRAGTRRKQGGSSSRWVIVDLSIKLGTKGNKSKV